MNYRLGQLGFLAHSALTKESPRRSVRQLRLDGPSRRGWHGSKTTSQALVATQTTSRFSASRRAASACAATWLLRAVPALFAKAIMMSGSCERPWAPLSDAESQGDAFARELTMRFGRRRARLHARQALRRRARSVCLLERTSASAPPRIPKGVGGRSSMAPSFNEQPSESFASGNFNRVPTIVGFTREEARLFTWLAELFHAAARRDRRELRDAPRLLPWRRRRARDQSSGRVPARGLRGADARLGGGGDPTRCSAAPAERKPRSSRSMFLRTSTSSNSRTADPSWEVALPFLGADPPEYDLAAFHSAEIPYVFGYDPLLQIDFEDFSTSLLEWRPDTADEALWLDTMGYFTRFAATGPPIASDWPDLRSEHRRVPRDRLDDQGRNDAGREVRVLGRRGLSEVPALRRLALSRPCSAHAGCIRARHACPRRSSWRRTPRASCGSAEPLRSLRTRCRRCTHFHSGRS